MSILIGALSAVSARVWMPWERVWFVDVDFDLADVPVMPSGRTAVKIGQSLLNGTIDPAGSGKFGPKARARVVAGAGAWGSEVPEQHWHSDGGVLSTAVLSATAAAVGEVLVDGQPTRWGVDYDRSKGPARRVLDGLPWYVDTSGTTIVGPRPPLPMASTVDVLSYDPSTHVAELASDELVLPGTILVDTRFGSLTIRDVEQTFGPDGARAQAWCGESEASQLASLLRTLVREEAGVVWLRTYRYTVVAQNPVDGRVTLQAKSPGVPDNIFIETWFGLPGVSVKVEPGTEVLLEFLEGDPKLPIVRDFKPGSTPLELTFSALKLNLGGETTPLATAPDLLTWATAVNGALNGLGAPVAPLAPTVASTRLFTE